jgi:ABC-type bacteriocin/lantibiotic exporter with double-glycine peptidase domain
MLSYRSESCYHVAVVVGVDDSWVYLNDPTFDSTPQQVSPSDFLRVWSPIAYMVTIVRLCP